MMRRVMIAAILAAAPAVAAAQAPPATLSLDEAVRLARQHNPDYLSRLNEEGVADWSVRSAYASFVPGASVSGGLSYQGRGQPLISGLTGGDFGVIDPPAYYYSSFAANMGLQLSGASFYRLGQEKASRHAVLAGVDAAGRMLELNVTRQYLAALRARDAVQLARRELERAGANHALAEARLAVQAATILEAKQAEVERGRAEVELLRAEALHDTERLRLLQQIGLDLRRDVELTTEVRVFEPLWDLESLVAAALGAHPQLEAGRATVASAEAGIGVARSAYFPTVSLSAGLSGFTRRAGSDQYLLNQAQAAMDRARADCFFANEILTRLNPPMPAQNCATIQLTDEDRANIIDQNRQFPFSFDRQPVSMSLGISVPVFQGLSRQRQLEAANAQADDARNRLRAEQLRIRADVETAFLNLNAAYRAERIETRNHELATDQLRLAQERYRVGAASFLELMEAETVMARADRAFLLGRYAFREALAVLEASVGQSLVIPEPNGP